MARLFPLWMIVGVLCLPVKIDAQNQLIELADIQVVNTLSALVQDPTSFPLKGVLVQEFTSDWKTVLRTAVTDQQGRFKFANVQDRKIYYLQLSTPGFDSLRLRVRVDGKRGTELKLKLTLAT
jgi:hypothetical protein